MSQENQSSFHMGRTVEDQYATEDLRVAYTAFECIVRSGDILDSVDGSLYDPEPECLSPRQAVAYYVSRVVKLGINRIREKRAERLYDHGKHLLDQLEQRD